MKSPNKNTRVVIVLVLVGLTMLGVAYGSVPFYRLFCKFTGYGGTTQRAQIASANKSERTVTVTFDTNVDKNLPWDFTPDAHSITVKLGETAHISFHAHNRSDKPVTGMSTFNVQPDKAGSYFNKIQCFCFDEQLLAPGQTAEFPVEFYVDPAMAQDKDTDDVTNITLSYTFFRAKDPKQSSKDLSLTSPTTTKPANSGNKS